MIRNGTLPNNMIGRQSLASIYSSAGQYDEVAYFRGLELALDGVDLDNLFA
jgi:hypothetical protein